MPIRFAEATQLKDHKAIHWRPSRTATNSAKCLQFLRDWIARCNAEPDHDRGNADKNVEDHPHYNRKLRLAELQFHRTI